MAIKEHGNGGITFTGEDIQTFRLMTLHSALKFEVKTGMKMRRGVNPYKIIKEEFGIKGNKAKVYEQFTELLRLNGLEVKA